MHQNSKNQGRNHASRASNREEQAEQNLNQNQQNPNRSENYERMFNDFSDNQDFFSDLSIMRRMNNFGNMRGLMKYGKNILIKHN